MSAAVHIRPMALSDLDRVMAIAESLRQAPHWPRFSYAAAIDPSEIPSRIALVAGDAEGNLLGFLIAAVLPPEAELESIAVAPESQRRGVARRLLQALMSELADRGVSVLLLEVRASNQPAQSLYRTEGFEATGRRPSYYTDPVEDAVILRRNVS